MTKPRLVAVTGGNGFVGRYFSRHARRNGFRLRQLSRHPASSFDPADETHPFSLDAESYPDEMLQGCDVLVHLAAHIPRDHRSIEEAELCWRRNVLATLRLVEAAARAGVGQLVQSGGANAYAPADKPPDENAAMFPRSRVHYLGSKMLQEICAEEACRHAGIRHTALRISAIYGSGQASGAIPRLMEEIANGRSIRLTGGGGYGADFVHVDDVARALLLVIVEGHSGPLNVGSGYRTTMTELAGMLVDLLGRDRDLIHVEGRPGEDPGFPALDVTRLRALGLGPRPLIAGLTEMAIELQKRPTASDF